MHSNCCFVFVHPLNKLIKTNKSEKIEDCNKSGIYQIDCEKMYIGKTKRNLNTRLKEHLRNVTNGEIEKSAIAAHAWLEKHRIETKAKLLKQLEKCMELAIWEKIYICKNKNKTMNFEIPQEKEKKIDLEVHPVGRPRMRWENIINYDLREVDYTGDDWKTLAQDRMYGELMSMQP
ncbi:hypothetical protein L9F63_018394 [Diploptera punctata]|uniref:GIY-YIG domain-containing protein n=1 Tax=Diploptera punctata TaxID=6984 RepID=A0AAD7ZWJ0_DIPPU|nr:hypothetical protein L9F63_018394 [Diploptera punctata]